MTSTISSWCNLTNETVFVTVYVLVVQGISPKTKNKKEPLPTSPCIFGKYD
jgi:hypothetical protein